MTPTHDKRQGKPGWAYCSTISSGSRCTCPEGEHEKNLLKLLDGNHAEATQTIKRLVDVLREARSAIAVMVFVGSKMGSNVDSIQEVIDKCDQALKDCGEV